MTVMNGIKGPSHNPGARLAQKELALEEVAQHHLQDPAMTVVVHLGVGIDSHLGLEGFLLTVFANSGDRQVLTWLEAVVNRDVERLMTGEA